jgi:hypothetical protein
MSMESILAAAASIGDSGESWVRAVAAAAVRVSPPPVCVSAGDPLARAEAHAKRLEATVMSERASNERLARDLGVAREQLSRCAGDLKKAQGLLSKSKDASRVAQLTDEIEMYVNQIRSLQVRAAPQPPPSRARRLACKWGGVVFAVIRVGCQCRVHAGLAAKQCGGAGAGQARSGGSVRVRARMRVHGK